MKTTLKIKDEINTNLLIVSRLIKPKMTKEKLTEKILEEGLKPYMKDLQRLKFE